MGQNVIIHGKDSTDVLSNDAGKGKTSPVLVTSNAFHSYLISLIAGEDVDADVLKIERRGNYETVAASQTDQALGATGAVGDVIDRIVIVPATTAPGAVSIKDGGGSAIPVYTGGTVGADLTPIIIPLESESKAGAWSVTTGANLSVIATGRFT